MKILEFTINVNTIDKVHEFTASGEVKSIEAIKEMGFIEEDGMKKVSKTGEHILVFNGRRTSPIKNKGLDKWYVVYYNTLANNY